jgi:succinoglycan biosynthesis protein ExoA
MQSDQVLVKRQSGYQLMQENSTLFVSVIVPVRNEARFIERTLQQLASQDYDREKFEIIVVDGESTDGTPALVERFASVHGNIRLIANPKRLSSAARNVAVREARGDVMLLVDGHCELAGKQCLRDLAEAFQRSGADCLGRPQPQDISNPTPLQRAIAAARSSRLGHHPDSYIYSSVERIVPAKSVAVAYRREVFEKIGGFDERFDACEDVEFNHRVDSAGLLCFFTPRIAAHYAPRGSLRGLFRQLFRYGRGRVRLGRKHPDTMSLKTLLPALFVLGCILGLCLAWTSVWLTVAYAVALASYFLLILTGSVIAAIRRRDIGMLPWLPPVFATIHFGAGAGLLWEAILGLRRRQLISDPTIGHHAELLRETAS